MRRKSYKKNTERENAYKDEKDGMQKLQREYYEREKEKWSREI